VTSAAVNGTTATITFDETVVTTGYDSGDFNFDCTTAGSNLALTSPQGIGNTRTFTVAAIAYGDTCNLDYVGSTNDVEDTAGNDLLTFSNLAVTNNSPQTDTTPPTVTGAVVDGAALTVTFSEPVVTTGYDAGDFNLDCSVGGTNVNVGMPSGSGDTRTFTLSAPVVYGEACDLDYVGSTNDVEDAAGNDMVAVNNLPITNSTPSAEDTTPPVRFNGLPIGTLAAGTTSVPYQLTTTEPAICRPNTSSGVAYPDTVGQMLVTGGINHQGWAPVSDGNSYSYYIRCSDAAGNYNTDDFVITFAIASAPQSYGTLSWEFPTYSAERSIGRIPVNIVRTGGSDGTVTVEWSSNGQTAFHDVDYYGNDNVLVTFLPGVTTMPINTYGYGPDGIEVIQNGATDDRYFHVVLSNPGGGAELGAPSTAVVTLLGEAPAPVYGLVLGGTGKAYMLPAEPENVLLMGTRPVLMGLDYIEMGN
jgi:hypothetical protein